MLTKANQPRKCRWRRRLPRSVDGSKGPGRRHPCAVGDGVCFPPRQSDEDYRRGM